ncbi:MAG: hypothetical protein NTW14_07200 [bacterium]|nr:hypothetical protein [bacterium]
MASDLSCMLRTLVILENFGRNFTQYFNHIIENCGKDINKIAVSLYGLTYMDIGRIKNEEFKKKEEGIIRKAQEWGVKIKEEPITAINDIEHHGYFNRFQSKRLWCALRDYIKNPEFNEFFGKAKALNGDSAKWWGDQNKGPISQLNKIELPGDVWNNNEIFRNCLIGKQDDKSKRTPEIMRDMYKKYFADNPSEMNKYYPEQFDVTFDFVPRMCETRQCNICFFGPNGIEKICNSQSDKLCMVALVTCGYPLDCTPDACVIKQNAGRYKGICDAPPKISLGLMNANNYQKPPKP